MKHRIFLPLEFIEQHNQKIHIYTHLKVYRKKLRMIVDTGATQTIIAEHIQNKYQFQTLQNTHGISAMSMSPDNLNFKIVIIPELKIQQLTLKNFFCLTMSFEHINKAYQKINIKPVDGIIGMDLLGMFQARILIDTKQLILKYDQEIIHQYETMQKFLHFFMTIKMFHT